LPDENASCPQEAMEVFVIAHMLLARSGSDLNNGVVMSNVSGDSMAACGRVFYWMNRLDMTIEEKKAACAEAIEFLMQHDLGAAADAIMQCEQHFFAYDPFKSYPPPAIWSIGEYFPCELAEICRNCLLQPSIQVGYFKNCNWHRADTFKFAIAMLGKYGNSIDEMVLRQFAAMMSMASLTNTVMNWWQS
jgi:hypothetical protein